MGRPATRLCALSVDLDEIPRYDRIHGRPPPGGPSGRDCLVYDVALPRIGAFAAEIGATFTLFAVGEDLERPASAGALLELARAGHPVENHSLSHPYDLTRLSGDALRAEIAGGARAIEAVTGRRPLGFRAPGYLVTDAVFDALEAEGVRFDASAFPSPAYQAAKALVLGGMRLAGRRSASILDTPRSLLAPRAPYRPGRPWYRPGGRSLVEIPVAVTRRLRLPFIGTSIAAAGRRGARALARGCVGLPVVNLELHGIDFLDASDGLADLAPHQRELALPLAARMGALRAALTLLRDAGYALVPLTGAAAEVEQALGCAPDEVPPTSGPSDGDMRES